MLATLSITAHINYDQVVLTLATDLGIPVPTSQELLANPGFRGFNYGDKLALRVSPTGESLITTMHGSGRGQTELFDKLMGTDIGKLRLLLSRQMRQINHDEVLCEGQSVSVFVSPDSVERIKRSIQECISTNGTLFWVDEWPRSHAWTEVDWEEHVAWQKSVEAKRQQEAADKARAASEAKTAEQELLKRIFGKQE